MMTDRLRPRDIWRQPMHSTTAVGCLPRPFPTGTVVINSTFTVTLDNRSQAMFTPLCSEGALPVAIHGKFGLLGLLSDGFDYGDSQMTDSQWPFDRSIAPVCIVLGVVTFLVWLLSISVATTSLLRRYRELMPNLCVIIVPPVCISIICIKTFEYVKHQYNHGYLDGRELVTNLANSNLVNCAMLICNIVALYNQVVTTTRLFSRKKEKIFIYFMGTLFIFAWIIFQALSFFLPNDSDGDEELLVLAYLIIVAISILYASCVLLYSFTKWRIAYRPAILPLAILSIIALFLPVVLFIADVCDKYVAGWDSIARLASLLVAGILVSNWVDRIEDYESLLEDKSVLGRKTYTEDETLVPSGDINVDPKTSDTDRSGDKLPEDLQANQEESRKWYASIRTMSEAVKQLFSKRPGTSTSYITTYAIRVPMDQIRPSRTPSLRSISTVSSQQSTGNPQPIIHIHPFRATVRKTVNNLPFDEEEEV